MILASNMHTNMKNNSCFKIGNKSVTIGNMRQINAFLVDQMIVVILSYKIINKLNTSCSHNPKAEKSNIKKACSYFPDV